MPNSLRVALALLAGILSSGLIVAGVEMIGHGFVSSGSLFVVAAVGLGVAAFVGGAVAIWIGKRPVLAWFVAATLACLSLINVFSFAHPIWFVPFGAALLFCGAFAATRLFRKSEDIV